VGGTRAEAVNDSTELPSQERPDWGADPDLGHGSAHLSRHTNGKLDAGMTVRWQLAGKRAAAVMSLLHSARINGHEPYAYFKDVLERLPTHPASRIDELLPHRWSPAS
jgi:hypothetical protein